jgi:hypothetical protein
MQEMVMWAAYAFGIFCAALGMEFLKALIWVSLFFVFARRLLRDR